jgi:hypothetical protein
MGQAAMPHASHNFRMAFPRFLMVVFIGIVGIKSSGLVG